MIITTKNGTEIIVDDDLILPEKGSISVSSHGYAKWITATGVRRASGSYVYKEEYLHRMVMRPRKGYQVDHINGNRLDNRKSNLRVCINSSNNQNKPKTSGTYKGVHFNKATSKWVAQITKNYKVYHLGSFGKIDDAALAYNKAAKKLHGKYAHINEI